MATHIDYQPLINDIDKSKKREYVLTQDKARHLLHNELPKSMFTKKYYSSGSNELIRYLRQKGWEIVITEPKITIIKRGKKQ